MPESGTDGNGRCQAGIIRVGGFAILFGLAIHIYVNSFVKQFPPENPSLVELQQYLSDQADSWAIVHGLRYVAFVCIALFGAGLFVRTSGPRTIYPNGWGVVGLLGCAMMLSNALITNGIEILAFFDFNRLGEDPRLFWLLFQITRVLFTAEIVTWAILILGFSMAGWSSSMLPKWLAGFGLLSATAGILTGVFIVSILNDGWAVILIDVASLTGLAWFLCAGVYMLLKGARSRCLPPPDEHCK